jgi:hypothetical protein
MRQHAKAGWVMKPCILVVACGLMLSACNQTVELQPVPGSITYGGQPSQKLTKSPIGSELTHIFVNQWGEEVHEMYLLQPDRTLRLVERHIVEEPPY